jgi:hypothetical protein
MKTPEMPPARELLNEDRGLQILVITNSYHRLKMTAAGNDGNELIL